MIRDRFHLLAVGVPADLAVRTSTSIGLPLRFLSGVTAEPDVVEHELEVGRTVAVLADAGRGVEFARLVHRVAPDAAVLFVGQDTEQTGRLTAELVIAPGIGRATRCLPAAGTPDEVDRLVVAASEELGHAVTRHRHLQTMATVRGAFDSLIDATPATLVRYLGRLFEHAPVAILVTDADGTVEAANPVVEDVLGRPPATAVGRDVAALLGGDAEVPLRSLVRECLEQSVARSTMLVRSGPDGADQHLEVIAAPVDPEVGGLGTIVLMHDETARIRALAAAERDRIAAVEAAARSSRLATTLQESLLPPSLPAIPGVDLAAAFRPAGDGTEIGGDFYDVFETADDTWCVVVGDVCGKGVGAARLTASTRYSLRAVAARSSHPARDLGGVNRVLRRQYEIDRERDEHRHATAAVARLRVVDDRIEVELASGGHPPPLVLRADGRIEETRCRGPLLGVFDDVTFVPDRVELRRGDVLVLFTDGLTEARRGDQWFGDTVLGDVLGHVAGRSADEVCRRLVDEALAFQDGAARDDLAIVAITPAAPIDHEG